MEDSTEFDNENNDLSYEKTKDIDDNREPEFYEYFREQIQSELLSIDINSDLENNFSEIFQKYFNQAFEISKEKNQLISFSIASFTESYVQAFNFVNINVEQKFTEAGFYSLDTKIIIFFLYWFWASISTFRFNLPLTGICYLYIPTT